ncbi:DUF4974 domain-containing protein [Chitinophaga sp. SYP-B3965]|uniref:FecR family protein n=1 Tax=Chitinophaga sp. SYP-B3965 TaxID=2663120 RepID=UPI00129959E3|nr:FecR domain-containing protein [Chitinophaga sp. SYP-B3965]MRG48038.1 DUF4974 domain-containing protein [Chitinophaga sp. SYP-B3965]
MENQHFKNKQSSGLLSKLIARYFEKQQESAVDSPDFESEKVYQRVWDAISEKQHRIVKLKRNLRIAAFFTLFAGAGGMAWYMNKQPSQMAMVEQSAARGETRFVELPDGTKVWLNADSKLRYPAGFKGKERHVELTGEAYFEVVSLPEKPFVIQTRDMKTEVLGTSFDVRAYSDNNRSEVTVLSGKVVVTAPGADTLHVTADHKLTYDRRDKQMQRQVVNAPDVIGWRFGKMIYRSREMQEVVADIERRYNIRIRYNEKIGKCTITADFHNEGLDKMLKVMAKLIDGTVTHRDGGYHLDGHGCE